jgi:hypothetical protein
MSLAGVVVLPSSVAPLVVDSRYRDNVQESVYNFASTLSAAVAGQFVSYAAMHWCQAVYPHTAFTAEFRFWVRESVEAVWHSFVCYHKPYSLFTSFDGNEDNAGGPYQTPVVGSYAYDFTRALMNDARTAADPLIVVDWSTFWTDSNFRIGCRYSASNGFQLFVTSTTEDKIYYIAIDKCCSVAYAHRVHGFGVPVPQTLLYAQGNRTTSSNFPDQFIPDWIANGLVSPPLVSVVNANTTPTLLPFRAVYLYCNELNRDRKVQSIHTTLSENRGNEIAIFPLLLQNQCRYELLPVSTDETVWTLTWGDQPQLIRFLMTDDIGQLLQGSNCFANFMNAPYPYASSEQPIDFYLRRYAFIDPTDGLRSTAGINELIFGPSPTLSSNTNRTTLTNILPLYDFTTLWGDPAAKMLAEVDIVHALKVIVGN